jgi:large subunit ribosomal protein L18
MVSKILRRIKIHKRIRSKVKGVATKPRLTVYRSNSEIYAQLIDDVSGKTVASSSSRDLKDATGNKTEISKTVGTALAAKAKAAGIEDCVFDRGGFLYHGRVKALADGAREGGLKF